MNTYSIELWDHDPAGDGTVEGCWSRSLAELHLGYSPWGLTLPQAGRALRMLRQHWGDESISVQREELA